MPVCPTCGRENPDLGGECPRCPDSFYIPEDVDATDDSYIGRKAAGKYVVLSKVSKGGMGTVYRALQLPVEREVAFKVLRTDLDDTDELRDRFKREARAISRIDHPNIVTLHDFGFDEDNFPYMVMEFVPGDDLNTWVEENELTLDRIVDVAGQILSGLGAAHREGIVHRDLKPENIIVSERGRETDFVKLLDFGIARMLDEQTRQGLTAEGDVFGTPHYMSPEQAEGDVDIGPASDVYACGVILYELLTEDVPFDAPTAMSILYQQINEDLPPLRPESDHPVSADLERIVQKATRKERDERYENAGEMLEALESATLERQETIDRRAGGVSPSELDRDTEHGTAAASRDPSRSSGRNEPSVRMSAEPADSTNGSDDRSKTASKPSAESDADAGADSTGGPISTLDGELDDVADELSAGPRFSIPQGLLLGLAALLLASAATYSALSYGLLSSSRSSSRSGGAEAATADPGPSHPADQNPDKRAAVPAPDTSTTAAAAETPPSEGSSATPTDRPGTGESADDSAPEPAEPSKAAGSRPTESPTGSGGEDAPDPTSDPPPPSEPRTAETRDQPSEPAGTGPSDGASAPSKQAESAPSASSEKPPPATGGKGEKPTGPAEQETPGAVDKFAAPPSEEPGGPEKFGAPE
ncbi:MAG: protein kinase [Bradymonadaceae bacterium]